MSRLYPPTADAAYRIVIERLQTDGATVYLTKTYGPYSTLGAARARLTHEIGDATRFSRRARGRIERSELNWKVIA